MDRQKQSKFIKEHAEEIANYYLNGNTKSNTAKQFNVSINGVERALYLTNNEKYCSNWFLGICKKFNSPKIKINVVKQNDNIVPTFEQMTSFMIDIMSRAKNYSTSLKEIQALKEENAKLHDELMLINKRYEELDSIKRKWELVARGQTSTFGD